jgi:hypothetical protein
MSDEPKRRAVRAGQPESELSRLKELWRTLSEDARAFWRSRLQSAGEGNTQPEIRRDILAKLKINLRHNSQLSDFKTWMERQDALDTQAERMQENERRLVVEHPDWSLDRVREEVLRQSYFETLATGDFKLGLKTVRADQNERILELDRAKFEFDAAKACLAKLPDLKAISEKPKLTEEEKTKAIQQILFNHD